MNDLNKNKIILQGRTLEIDHNGVAELMNDLINKGKSEKFNVSLKDFIGKASETCEVTGEKGAIKFISCFSKKENDVCNYTLKPSVMIRLLSHNLMPSEFKKLSVKHQNEYLIHDDFYEFDGTPYQPITYRYFEKGEYKKFNRDELKNSIRSDMANQIQTYRIFYSKGASILAKIKGVEMNIQEVIDHTFNDKKGWWNHLEKPHYNICQELLSGKPEEDVINEVVGFLKLNDKIVKEKELSR